MCSPPPIFFVPSICWYGGDSEVLADNGNSGSILAEPRRIGNRADMGTKRRKWLVIGNLQAA
jgi:hypothetical protein